MTMNGPTLTTAAATLLLFFPPLLNAFGPSFASVARHVASDSSTPFGLHARSNRRDFLANGGMAAVTALLPQIRPAFADDGVDYKAVAKDIMNLVKDDPDKGPSTY